MPFEVWTASEIKNCPDMTGLPDGRWIPSRPMVWWLLLPRLKAAWGVLTAKYDALDWQDRH